MIGIFLYSAGMNILDTFKSDIETFLKDSKMSATLFGTNAVGDGNFVLDMRTTERSPSAKTMQRVYDFMASQTEVSA